eukprot:NODE_426_length_7665_cov_0.708961.p5 type:complete len:190 gc:universal NODE_426_length_7665_cov_0.708961:4690-4121(-)
MHFMYLMAVGLLCQQMHPKYQPDQIENDLVQARQIFDGLEKYQQMRKVIQQYNQLMKQHSLAQWKYEWAGIRNDLENVISQVLYFMENIITIKCNDILESLKGLKYSKIEVIRQLCLDVHGSTVNISNIKILKRIYIEISRLKSTLAIIVVFKMTDLTNQTMEAQMVQLRNVMHLLNCDTNNEIFKFEE